MGVVEEDSCWRRIEFPKGRESIQVRPSHAWNLNLYNFVVFNLRGSCSDCRFFL